MLWNEIVKKAKLQQAKIAIGAGEDNIEAIVKGSEKAEALGYAKVSIVSSRPLKTKINCIVAKNPELKIIQLLKQGIVDGVVRGSLDINKILRAFNNQFQIKKILRLALLQAPGGQPFFFAPVGVDDGWTIKEKVELGVLGSELMKKFGVKADIGVLSGGRLSDVWRSKRIAKSIKEAQQIARKLVEKGLKAEHAQILLEKAIIKHNFVIAPNGFCGNLIFRSLCLVGKGTGFGAPILGTDIIYVDTSREKKGNDYAICLASAMTAL